MKKWLIHDSRAKNIFEPKILLNYIFCYSRKHFNTYSQNLRSYMLSHQIINSHVSVCPFNVSVSRYTPFSYRDKSRMNMEFETSAKLVSASATTTCRIVNVVRKIRLPALP